MTSGFFSAVVPFDPFDPLAGGLCSVLGVVGLDETSGMASLAGVSRSVVDLDGTSDDPLISVPGVGEDAKSLYELSVIRGIFHGNLRNDIQQ